jgi:hypothetical protein
MDVDIDFGDRSKLIDLITCVQASSIRDNEVNKHPTGVYFQRMPQDPVSNLAAVDYRTAEEMGFFKIDLLNVNVYQQIRDIQHLDNLMMQEPVWELLQNEEFVNQLSHINNHYDLICAMPERITSIDHLAMFLAILRPAKRHLVGCFWADVEKTVWQKSENGKFAFKRSHAIAYAHLVVVHMNLLCERLLDTLD